MLHVEYHVHAGGGDRLGSMETMHVVQQIEVSPELIVLVTSEVQQKHFHKAVYTLLKINGYFNNGLVTGVASMLGPFCQLSCPFCNS